MFDVILYMVSVCVFVYGTYFPHAHTAVKQVLFVLYGAVVLSDAMAITQNSITSFMLLATEHAFHVLLSIGTMGTAMILLLMYRADKIPMYYYKTMVCVVAGVHLASQDTIVDLFIGVVLIVIGLYYKANWTDFDKNGVRIAYKKGVSIALICMAVGIGIIWVYTDFSTQYYTIAMHVYKHPSLLFYVGSLLVFVGGMGLIGMVPFSTALLNVHRIFEQPLVMVNRVLVATTLFLILGNVIISIYAYSSDIFWRHIFMAMGFLAMTISIVGSVMQNSLKRLYGYVALGHIGFISIIISTEQVHAVALAIQYSMGYVLSYMAFWSYARSVYVGRKSLDTIYDLSLLQNSKPYYTFWFAVSALCFAGFPPFAVFWGKILILGNPEYWGQSLFEVLVILIFVQGIWSLRFMYFAYIYPVPAKKQGVYTQDASFLTGIMRVILSGLAIFYVFL